VAALERQGSQVSKGIRQVISGELCEGPKVKISVSQGKSFLARAFDLARLGVAPPLHVTCKIVPEMIYIMGRVGH